MKYSCIKSNPNLSKSPDLITELQETQGNARGKHVEWHHWDVIMETQTVETLQTKQCIFFNKLHCKGKKKWGEGPTDWEVKETSQPIAI